MLQVYLVDMHIKLFLVPILKYVLSINYIALLSAGDDIKKLEENYNQAQKVWIDNMINACQVVCVPIVQ